MNGIEAIQQQNIYRVNPINFFERAQRREDNNIFRQQTGFSLNHPVVAGSPTQARSLDLLA